MVVTIRLTADPFDFFSSVGRTVDFARAAGQPKVDLPSAYVVNVLSSVTSFNPIGSFVEPSFDSFGVSALGAIKVDRVGDVVQSGGSYVGSYIETWHLDISRFSTFTIGDALFGPSSEISFGGLKTFGQIDGRTFGKLITEGARIFGTPENDKLAMTNFGEIVFGGAGDDTINGRGGNDDLYGEAGKDKLTGGAGKDEFIFKTALGKTNVDTITDYFSREDTLILEDRFFAKVDGVNPNGTGRLVSDQFVRGPTAVDLEDRIIYTPKGLLLYDPDGIGPKAAVHFATLANKAGLNVGDFLIV